MTLDPERARLLARLDELDLADDLPPAAHAGRTPHGFVREVDAVRDILLGTREHCMLAVNRILTARVGNSAAFVRGGYCSPGGADLLGTIRACGHALAVEVKALRGRLEPEQKLFARRWQSSRGVWICARTAADVLAVVLPHVERCPAVEKGQGK